MVSSRRLVGSGRLIISGRLIMRSVVGADGHPDSSGGRSICCGQCMHTRQPGQYK